MVHTTSHQFRYILEGSRIIHDVVRSKDVKILAIILPFIKRLYFLDKLQNLANRDEAEKCRDLAKVITIDDALTLFLIDCIRPSD